MLTCLVAAASITAQTALPEIAFGISDKEFLKGSSFSGDLESVPETSEIKKTQVGDCLRKAFERYPAELLTGLDLKIYVVRSVKVNGVGYGGFWKDKPFAIVLVSGQPQRMDNVRMNADFHHEFSSILLSKNRRLFPIRDWIKSNEESFRYQFWDGGFTANKTGKSGHGFVEDLNEKGIVCEYGTSDFENDYNTYAEYIMGFDSNAFWKEAHKHPRMLKKAQMFVEFYKKVDPKIQIPPDPLAVAGG